MAWVDEMLSGIPVNAVLRERLLLESEKRVMVATQAEAKISALQTENEVLRHENSQLKEKLRGLEGDVSKNHGSRLEEFKEKILALVAAQDGIPDHAVAQSLNIGGQLATFHLQELESAHLARRTLTMGQRITPWHITQEGRRYLVSHGLLI